MDFKSALQAFADAEQLTQVDFPFLNADSHEVGDSAAAAKVACAVEKMFRFMSKAAAEDWFLQLPSSRLECSARTCFY